jgi:hypothetical protein
LIPKRVLITGGSGLIGSHLTQLLQERGVEVVHLGRSAKASRVPVYTWNPAAGKVDERAFAGVDAIIHLAGAGVADQRWTARRKRELLESRTSTTQLLHRFLATHPHQVKTFVSASAIGYYNTQLQEEAVESEPAGDHFLARITRAWEEAADQVEALGIRTVKIRIGIVLSPNAGALPAMARPVRLIVGAVLGTGRQPMSWIHIHDLCRLFLYAMENEAMRGPYNGVGGVLSHREFTRTLARVLHRPLWLPPVPAVILKLLLGEMATMVLEGRSVSAGRLRQAGFTCTFTNLEAALTDLLRQRAEK